jgi:hypothetical protein
VGLFLVLGCGLGFVWLLLWLWERFFNIDGGLCSIGCLFENQKAIKVTPNDHFLDSILFIVDALT